MKKLFITRNWICSYTKFISRFRSSPEKDTLSGKSGLLVKPFYPEQMPADHLLIISSLLSPEKPVRHSGEIILTVPGVKNDRNRRAGILRSTVFFNWKDLA
jgi:hypothetical protein